MYRVIVNNIIIIVVAFIAYYKLVLVVMRDKLVPPVVPLVTRLVRGARGCPVSDIENVVTLMFSIVFQLFFFLLLARCTSFPFSRLWPRSPQPTLLVLGAVLGVGEMLFCSFLGLIVIKLSSVIPQMTNPLGHWEVVLNSGWMRLFNTAVNLLPIPAAIPIIVLYIGIEELIIRCVVLTALLPLGDISAILLSTLIFAAYQVFNLPSWKVALFPVMGALVIGPIHGLLYVTVPDVWPLVVAHATYFSVIASTFRRGA
jgi:hypothetical protein